MCELFLLFKHQKVDIFKIPPRPFEGHRAELWTEKIWEGFVVLYIKNDQIILKLVDENEVLFAQCVIPHNYETVVEKAIDSSRYFSIRVENTNDKNEIMYSFIGIFFEERTVAFNFLCTINDFYRFKIFNSKFNSVIEKKKLHKMNEGEKITIKIKGLKVKERKETNDKNFDLESPK
ncbi:NECAP-like protein, putative [Plasmodium gallinaceum]|uniref:NECAP-like protein, putative n=1 Tax=Plasmodium gallinaceum TaxID=5849 RepID=A0A1J1GWG8_PLAGA|nr:NECAP-like protein, putative [Plasmodium gallinaceum]CRG96607.1 NECAP-like protein, putative [Plasmodium gallinaceum]